MDKLVTLKRLKDTRFLVIMRVNSFQRACTIIDACIDGGIDCVEISYNSNNPNELINDLSNKYGDKVMIGAGTVLDSETARLAILSGAKFIIAPNYNESVSKICNRYQIPYMPGCTSISEAISAMESGASMIKAFPISNFYGSSFVKIFKTPLPQMPIMTSGGITLENADDWIKTEADSLGVGSLLTTGTKEDITKNAKILVEKLQNYRNLK